MNESDARGEDDLGRREMVTVTVRVILAGLLTILFKSIADI